MILFSSIIPISLRVNIDMAKTAFSSFMMADKLMPPPHFFFLVSVFQCFCFGFLFVLVFRVVVCVCVCVFMFDFGAR